MFSMKRNIVLLCVMLLFSAHMSAQSLKDLFNKDNIKETVTNLITGNSESLNVEGQWTFESSAVEFESDNLLKKAGGALAASKLEEELSGMLEKVGIVKGSIEYTFNADSSFVCKTKNTPLSGTYSINNDDKTMTMSYVKGLLKSTCKVNRTGDKLVLLYDADKLIPLVSTIAGSVNIEILNTISKLLSSYDGCNIGLELSLVK